MLKHDLTTYSQKLTHLLIAQGHIVSVPVEQAFSITPRHEFFPYYYELDQKGYHLRPATDRAEWLSRIYSDVPLVTKIDDNGRCLRSSLQPSIVATMLECLEVQPNQRVFEIGTGSGYSTALLTNLTGDPRLVTTIDDDEDVLTLATSAFERTIGQGITVLVGNGLEGYPPGAPYDRILATVSMTHIPPDWYQQLVPGGILVCMLQYNGMGGVIKAVKDATTHVLHGKFQRAAFFKPNDDGSEQNQVHLKLNVPLKETFPLDLAWFDPYALSNYHFRYFFTGCCPHAEVCHTCPQPGVVKQYYISSDHTREGYVSILHENQTYFIQLHGDFAFYHWERLVQTYLYWTRLGRPEIADYEFFMDKTEQYLCIQRQPCVFYPFSAAH